MYEDAILFSCEQNASELDRFFNHLYNNQTECEKKIGDSTEKNGIGLTCFEARAVSKGKGDRLKIVTNHLSQLSRAVENGKIEKPRFSRRRGSHFLNFLKRYLSEEEDEQLIFRRGSRRKLRVKRTIEEEEQNDLTNSRKKATFSHSNDEALSKEIDQKLSDKSSDKSSDELSDESGDKSEEIEGDAFEALSVTAAGLYHEKSRTVVALNHRAHRMFVETAMECNSFDDALAKVVSKINWTFPVLANDLDIALFQERKHLKIEKGYRVRVFCPDKGVWLNAKVTRLDNRLRKYWLKFDDCTSGTVSMHDAEIMYASPW